MSTKVHVSTDKMIFRRTNGHVGRRIAVSPENSPMRHLTYGRIILNPTQPSVRYENGGRETGLICFSGEAQVSAAGVSARLSRYDAMYIPRDGTIEISTASNVDFAELSADVANRYPVQVVHHADIEKDPGLRFQTGGPGCIRHLHMLLAKNIEAGRLVAGLTFSDPGNWTSWPPHEHAKLLEELYVYCDMPEPAFGIQLVYSDANEPEVVAMVREGDAVLMPSGYHPNVSVPGHRIGFLWAMAAHEEKEGRLFGVVNVQPGFQIGTTGLEAGRK
jgi:5-deoxy-glucuronate isomerase